MPWVGIKWGSGMLTFVFTEGSRVALYLPGQGHIQIGSMTIGMSLQRFIETLIPHRSKTVSCACMKWGAMCSWTSAAYNFLNALKYFSLDKPRAVLHIQGAAMIGHQIFLPSAGRAWLSRSCSGTCAAAISSCLGSSMIEGSSP